MLHVALLFNQQRLQGQTRMVLVRVPDQGQMHILIHMIEKNFNHKKEMIQNTAWKLDIFLSLHSCIVLHDLFFVKDKNDVMH